MPCTTGRRAQWPAAAPLLVALLGWSAASGCATHPGSAGGRLRMPTTTGNGCLGAHLAAVDGRQKVDGVAGSGKVHFVSGSDRGRASFDFVFLRPDTVQLQFSSPLGPAAAVLELDRDRYLFVDFHQGTFIQGGTGEEDFFRLTGLPVKPRTLISLLLGEPLPGRERVGLVRFDQRNCLPLACELESLVTPGLPVEVSYQWPEPAPDGGLEGKGLSLPERVVFSGPGPDRKITIRFRSFRPLDADQGARALEPIDTSGLRRVMPGDTAEDRLPRWIR